MNGWRGVAEYAGECSVKLGLMLQDVGGDGDKAIEGQRCFRPLLGAVSEQVKDECKIS